MHFGIVGLYLVFGGATMIWMMLVMLVMVILQRHRHHQRHKGKTTAMLQPKILIPLARQVAAMRVYYARMCTPYVYGTLPRCLNDLKPYMLLGVYGSLTRYIIGHSHTWGQGAGYRSLWRIRWREAS
jgi:hypothetical protein